MNKLEPIVKTADLVCICSSDFNNTQISSSTGSEINKEFSLFALSGLVYELNKQPALYSFSNYSLPILKEEVEDLKGEWVAILANNDNTVFKIVSDHFGFQSVFYRFDKINVNNSQLVISTNYNSIIEYSKNSGLNCTLNDEQFYLAMGAKNIRLRTAFSTKTFCREINLMRVDESLYFDSKNNTLKLQRKDFLFDPLGRSYEELLASGIKKAKQDIKSMTQFFHDKRLFLSGGRDSRMVLALLSSLGLNEEYSISGANPNNFAGYSKEVIQNDLYVSNFLAQKYKMKFSQLGEHVKLDLSPEESLKSVLSHWSQFSWTIKPLNRAIFPKNVYLTLRGGGGELIRASAASRKAILDIEKNNSSFSVLDIASQVDDLFDLFVSTDSIPSEYMDKCRVLFSESFIFDKNYSLEQNIDWHYHYYRNRSHFGQYISFYARNEVTFHPLMQKEFFYAANCIDLTARREGKVCYDIIEKLEPQLNQITFDDGFWPHIAYSKEPHLEFLKDDSNKSLENYYKTQDENAVFLRNPIALNSAENKSKDSFSKHELYIFAINSLFELVYDSKYKVQNIINIINNMNYGKSSSTEIFMKLIDYQNLTKQYRTYCNLLFINGGFEKKYLKNPSYVNTEMFLLNYTESLKNFSYSVSREEGISLTAYLNDKFKDFFNKIEYAFYLYENKNILARQWYSTRSIFSQNSLVEGKSYFVRIFIKISLKDQVLEPIIIDSDTLSI